ncbi:MAG: amino acid ABC transporter substrate-binding protein, partial [Chloroflexi bacterium]
MRKLFPVFSLLVLASLVLAACGSAATVTPVTGDVTPIVEDATPLVTAEIPATGDETPTPTPAAATAAPVAGGERLQAVLDRGQVICGVHGTFQGFGFVESDGSWTGFDVDFCRAWAAALFNDADAVEFRGLSAQERFTALQSGEVDVLARNSTWTWA